MQQALEAIRIFREWEMGQDYDSNRDTVLVRAFAAQEALEAALAQTERKPEHEPVAWIVHEDGVRGLRWSRPKNGMLTVEPLYTSPPQRKPLTDEDARLIAAAPDLLAALQGLLRGIANGPDEANAAMLVAKARDAVNKATGEK